MLILLRKGLPGLFGVSVELMQILARAFDHNALRDFSINNLTTWKKDMADLFGVSFDGANN